MQRKYQTFLGERHVPVEHFIGLPAPWQSGKQMSRPGPCARRLTSRGRRGDPGEPATRARGSSPSPPPGKWKRGTEQNLPRLTPPEGEGVLSGDSREVSSSRAQGETGRARGAVGRSLPEGTRAGAGREGSPRPVRGKQPERGRGRTHLGEEVVHCSSAFPHSPESGVQLAEVSPAEGPGKPCVSRRDSQELEPSGLPRCHRLIPFSSFAPFVRPNPIL